MTYWICPICRFNAETIREKDNHVKTAGIDITHVWFTGRKNGKSTRKSNKNNSEE